MSGPLLDNPEPVILRETHDLDDPAWHRVRADFFEEDSIADHQRFLATFAKQHRPYFAIIAEADGRPVGFAEISVRRDYVNGCKSSPVLYLEGIYVDQNYRKMGLARRLCEAAEAWGRANGMREFASDSDLDNTRSIESHKRLGFHEVDRVVCFSKPIAP